MDLKVRIGTPTWIIRESVIGMPSSWAMMAAISSPRASMPSATAVSSAARSCQGVCDQASNASRAAATARSTSSGVPAGIRPMTSSVVALTTSMVSLPAGSTHAPPM